METSTLPSNIKQKPISFEKKESLSSSNSIFKSLITSASKNLEVFSETLAKTKEKFKSEADNFMQILKKSEENISNLIEEKTKYYDSIKEKVNGIFARGQRSNEENKNFENLDLNEDKQIQEILYESNDFLLFYKNLKTIHEEIKHLEELKENKALKEYVENTKGFLEQAGLIDIFANSKANLAESNTSDNSPIENALLNKSKKEIDANCKNESASVSSESEKIANKYVKYETPTSNKFIGKKRLHSSEADIESTNTNNHQDEIDLLKDSEENSANEAEKKNNENALKNEKNPNNITKDSNSSVKKNNRYAMKREIIALGLSVKTSVNQAKKQNTTNNSNSNANNNGSKNITSTLKEQQANNNNENTKEKNQVDSMQYQNSSNSVYSETIDLVSSNPNLNNNNSNSSNNNAMNKITTNASNNNKSKSKSTKSNLETSNAIKASVSEFVITPKDEIILPNQTNNSKNNNQNNQNIEQNNSQKQNLYSDNPIIRSSKFIDLSSDFYQKLDTLGNLIKRDKNNFAQYIIQNFEECLFKQRIYYCEFDMLNKNRKCTSDLLAKDSVFENNENYEYVKLTIVRKGKQNINNLLKSMENFFKQYIKRKDIDGSAVIKGTINCSFDKLQKYFTMQMRSFEYCEAIQFEVYLFKWDLFYDFNEKEDKTNLDSNIIKQYVNFGNILRETRIMAKKRNLMLQANM